MEAIKLNKKSGLMPLTSRSVKGEKP